MPFPHKSLLAATSLHSGIKAYMYISTKYARPRHLLISATTDDDEPPLSAPHPASPPSSQWLPLSERIYALDRRFQQLALGPSAAQPRRLRAPRAAAPARGADRAAAAAAVRAHRQRARADARRHGTARLRDAHRPGRVLDRAPAVRARGRRRLGVRGVDGAECARTQTRGCEDGSVPHPPPSRMGAPGTDAVRTAFCAQRDEGDGYGLFVKAKIPQGHGGFGDVATREGC